MAAHGDGAGRRAVVVGCGLGADSEPLARHGWRTTAFDISPAAVAAVRDRYPDSAVDYREGNLLDLTGHSADLVGAFDLVVEIYTLRALHPSLPRAGGRRRARADGDRRAGPRRPGRPPDDQPVSAEPPWTLTRTEMEAVAGGDVLLDGLDEVLPEGRVNPLWRMVLTRR